MKSEKLLNKIFGLSKFDKEQAQTTVLPVRAVLYENRASCDYAKPLAFTWGWCCICKCAFVRCPICGHSSCSPTYGRLENGKICDCCELSFQYLCSCKHVPTEKQIKRAKGRLLLDSDLKLAQDERKKK